MHALFLAAFFWLNTMCFNIWWTFRWVFNQFKRLIIFNFGWQLDWPASVSPTTDILSKNTLPILRFIVINFQCPRCHMLFEAVWKTWIEVLLVGDSCSGWVKSFCLSLHCIEKEVVNQAVGNKPMGYFFRELWFLSGGMCKWDVQDEPLVGIWKTRGREGSLPTQVCLGSSWDWPLSSNVTCSDRRTNFSRRWGMRGRCYRSQTLWTDLTEIFMCLGYLPGQWWSAFFSHSVCSSPLQSLPHF